MLQVPALEAQAFVLIANGSLCSRIGGIASPRGTSGVAYAGVEAATADGFRRHVASRLKATALGLGTKGRGAYGSSTRASLVSGVSSSHEGAPARRVVLATGSASAGLEVGGAIVAVASDSI